MVFREYNFGAIVSVVMLRRGISKATLQVTIGMLGRRIGCMPVVEKRTNMQWNCSLASLKPVLVSEILESVECLLTFILAPEDMRARALKVVNGAEEITGLYMSEATEISEIDGAQSDLSRRR